MAIKVCRIKITLFLLITCLFWSSHSSHAQDQQDPWEQPPRQISLQGKIEAPVNGSRVPRHFAVRGIVSGTYRHLWLVERVGQLYWPKEPELKADNGEWKGEVFEGGWPPEGRFEILLIDVSTETSNAFRRWLATGHQTGHYPGLNSEDMGAEICLDQKQYRLIAN